MRKKFYLGLGIGLVSCLANSSVFADSLVSFDFDALGSKAYRSKNAKSIESYMESIYGEDISVSKGTQAFKGHLNLQGSPLANYIGQPTSGGMYLRNKGKNPILLDFGANGINSFSVDWKLFKNAKGLTILADGVIIDQHALDKAQKKFGANGNFTLYFGSAVHQLQFVGTKNSRFGLDNLLINLPISEGGDNSGYHPTTHGPDDNDNDDNDNNEGEGGPGETLVVLEDQAPLIINQTESVPEPASLLLMALGLCGAWWSRRQIAGS